MVRFSVQSIDGTQADSSCDLPHMLGRPKSDRLVARLSVRLRREGGSLSLTVPRHISRHWKLKEGDLLVVRSTDEGILLYPRYFLPYRRPKEQSD